MSKPPAVSIGLPVYNGGAFVQAAITSLLAQDFTDLELVISDNGSTDDTQAICERFSAADQRVRYYRNDSNRGPLFNFMRVLELATGDRFMWASHDDTWSPTYISELRSGFELGSGVILSAGQTLYVNADGSPSTFPMAHAPPHSVVEVEPLVTMLLQQHATSWFYGLYDRRMLVPLLARIRQFPGWGSDLLFLFHCCLNYRVVGSDAAKIFKRVRPGRSWASPANMDEWRAWKIEFTRHLVGQLIDANLPLWRKLRLVDEVTRYVWRMVIHLGNAPTLPQWALAQLGRVRREIRGISRRG